MKIFISHSSKNEDYGNALVDLLINVGIKGEQIIFTSNDAFGIPTGQNIFNWLKNEISEKPYVIYLLSQEYYSSVACLNEMGAAWIIENEHTMIFTPNFNIKSYEFQNGALDPREIGFFIDNQDRLTGFIESLKSSFTLFRSPIIVNQSIRKFLARIDSIESTTLKSSTILHPSEKTILTVENEVQEDSKIKKNSNTEKRLVNIDSIARFFSDLVNDKLKDEEVLLVYYIIDTAKFKLGTGWQEPHEIENIKTWEDISDINNTLSINYSAALRRLEMRKLTEVSALTGHGNPKEIKLIESMQETLIDLPEEFLNKINEVVNKNQKEEFPF